jgi:hypothetical protein
VKKLIPAGPAANPELRVPSGTQPAPKPDKARAKTAAEVRRLLALADKLTNTAQALRKEAAAKLRQAQRA